MRNKPANNHSKSDFVQGIFKGDLDKFLKRVYKKSYYQLNFSTTLKEWAKESPELVAFIKKRNYPGIMNNICNIHQVMVKYYGSEINIESFKLSERLEEVLTDSIWKYVTEKRRYDTLILGKDEKLPNKKEALKELKKRGFAKVIDFEDYDPSMGHIATGGKLKETKLYYPMNFKVGQYITRDPRDINRPSITLAHEFIGIKGFTRIITPKDR